eukprot:TRINITY_DN23008_c0_g1_i1.p1 TRINITY_DN23008_c0_g1~~TRINITY_DN23008_c0_g1_i1.p1  ORF type:complete len:1349 (+),score=232.89 TRINITY_DN23008_c0_g1_i1:38-4048(+)
MESHALLTVQGAVKDASGRLVAGEYHQMVAAFKRQEGTLATAADQHPDTSQPGVRAGEVVTDGLQMWDDTKRSRDGSGGALKQGAGWIAEFKRPGGEIESRKFNVRTWGSWRLAFLLARLQRALWDEEFQESSDRKPDTVLRRGSETSSASQKLSGALRRRFRSKSVDPVMGKDAAASVEQETSVSSVRATVATPTAAHSAVIEPAATRTTIAAKDAPTPSVARNQKSCSSSSSTSIVDPARPRAANVSAASPGAKLAKTSDTAVDSCKTSKVAPSSISRSSNSVVADGHVQSSPSGTSAAMSSSSNAMRGNRKRLAGELVQNSCTRAKSQKSSSSLSDEKYKLMSEGTEKGLASKATLAAAREHAVGSKTRIPGLETCLERGSGIGKRCVRRFVSLMSPDLAILDQTLLVNHLRLTERHQNRLKRFVEQGGVARLVVWMEAALMQSGLASDLFLDCTFKALRLLPLRGMAKGAAQDLLEVIGRVRSRMSKAKLVQQPVQTSKDRAVVRSEKLAASGAIELRSGPNESKVTCQGRVGKGDGKGKKSKGSKDLGADRQAKANIAWAARTEMANHSPRQNRPAALKKPMAQSHDSAQPCLQQRPTSHPTMQAQRSLTCDRLARQVPFQTSTPGRGSLEAHANISSQINPAPSIQASHQVNPSLLLSLPKTPPRSHSAPSTPPRQGPPWQGATDVTSVQISCSNSSQVSEHPGSPLLRYPKTLTTPGNTKPLGISCPSTSSHIAKSTAITSQTAKGPSALPRSDIAKSAPKTPPLVNVRIDRATLPLESGCPAPKTLPVPQALRVHTATSVPKTPPLSSMKPAFAKLPLQTVAQSAPKTPPLSTAKAVLKPPPSRKSVLTPALAAELHIESAVPKTPPLQDLGPRQQPVKSESSLEAPWRQRPTPCAPSEVEQQHHQWPLQQPSLLQQLQGHVKAEPFHPVQGKAEPEVQDDSWQLYDTRHEHQEPDWGCAQVSREQASARDLRFLEWSRLHEEVSALEAQISAAAAAEHGKENMELEQATPSTRLPAAFNAKVQELERKLSAAVSSAGSSAPSVANHVETWSAEPSSKTPHVGLESSNGLDPAWESESEEESSASAIAISPGTSPRQSRTDAELVNLLETLAAIATSSGDTSPALHQETSSPPRRHQGGCEWTANQNPVSASSLEELLQSQASASGTQMRDSQAYPGGTSIQESQATMPISDAVPEGLTDALVRALSRSSPAAVAPCAVPSNPSEPEQGSWQQHLSNSAMSAAMTNFTEAALTSARATAAAASMLSQEAALTNDRAAATAASMISPEVTLTVNPQVASVQMLEWQTQYLQHQLQLQQVQWTGQHFALS